MGSRRRVKSNPKAQDGSHENPLSQEGKSSSDPREVDGAEENNFSNNKPVEEVGKTEDGTDTQPVSRSWYLGTWPRGNKAAPATQVNKQSISAAAGSASDAAAIAHAQSSQIPSSPPRSSAVYQRLENSTRSLPLAAQITKLNVASDAPSPASGVAKQSRYKNNEVPDEKKSKAAPISTECSKAVVSTTDEAQQPIPKDVELAPEPGEEATEAPKPSGDSVGWLAWFSKSEQAKALDLASTKRKVETNQSSETVKTRPQSTITENDKAKSAFPTRRRNSEPTQAPSGKVNPDKSRYWLHLWGTANKQSESPLISTTAQGEPHGFNQSRETLGEAKTDAKPASGANSDVLELPKSTGWAFWAKDAGRREPSGEDGKLALADASFHSKPENDTVEPTKGKVQRERSLQVEDHTGQLRGANNISITEEISMPPPVGLQNSSIKNVPTTKKQERQNLILPSLEDTYRSAIRPGLLQQLNRWFSFASYTHLPRVDIASSPPRIKRALAIGVHGYFPAPLVRSLLGQPTGTSIRFANSAASAIQRWTQDQGYSCEVEEVALEGEGKVAERIDLLWKLMLNWIDKIRKADFVMVACHSQGCPVAIMLVAKLISFGCVSTARIGVCAMAGVNLGPFVDYNSRWISGTAGELFEFAKADSRVSKEYEAALDIALRFGVKIVYVGSIDDQLVSLEVSHCLTGQYPISLI